MKKRILCFILIFSLLLGCSPAFAADEPASWAREEVEAAIASALVPACLQCRYAENIIREDFALLLTAFLPAALNRELEDILLDHCGKSSEAILAEAPFTDCSSPDVVICHALGLINGRGNGIFDPAAFITRQEAAALLMRLGQFCGLDSGSHSLSFSDSGLISDYALEAVDYVSSLDIMHGMGDGRFAPHEHYSRQQAYICMIRMLGLAEKPVPTPPPQPGQWTGVFDSGTLFIGDSNTYHFVTRYLQPMGYMGQASAMACVNFGVPHFFSDKYTLTAADWNFYGCVCDPDFAGMSYYRAIEAAAGRYSNIYVLLGSNVSLQLTAENYRQVIEFISDANPNATVYLQTVPDCHTGAVGTWYVNGCIEDALEAMLADGRDNLVLLDTNAVWVPGCVAFDGVHLTAAGYEAWYKLISDTR